MALRLLAALVVLLFSLMGPVSAQERVVPSSAAQLRLSYAPVVKRVAPAVVNVYAARKVDNRNLMEDPFFRFFFGRGGVPREQVQRSLGSGVIVDPAGLIVTNNHVVEGADQVKVSLSDKREFDAEIVLKDSRTDLAVLRIKDGRERFPALEFGNSDELQVGDLVLAVGNPFGVGQTVTHGIVSALARTQIGITDYQFFIQTDAAINPGNSGGALVDAGGNLVGINTAIFSRTGGSMGIGFAIPVSTAKMVFEQIAKNGSVTRGWIGVELAPVLGEQAREGARGALIAGVLRGGPADKGGVKPGDIVVDVNGRPVADPTAMLNAVAALEPGASAKVALKRQGSDVEVAITIGRRPKPQGLTRPVQE
jgi:Do/DeqQ family serine protease